MRQPCLVLSSCCDRKHSLSTCRPSRTTSQPHVWSPCSTTPFCGVQRLLTTWRRSLYSCWCATGTSFRWCICCRWPPSPPRLTTSRGTTTSSNKRRSTTSSRSQRKWWDRFWARKCSMWRLSRCSASAFISIWTSKRISEDCCPSVTCEGHVWFLAAVLVIGVSIFN